jgi:anthranilate synthase component 2
VIFLLDNYDSFTYNLYQALSDLGASVEVARNDELTVDEIAARLDAIDGIVLSPGPCTPADAGISIELVQRLAGQRPILGVCLGHQAVGAAFGARIVHAPYLMHGKTSEIRHDGHGLFDGLPNPFTATRYHSLIVDPETLPAELKVTARSEEGVIMGLRHESLPVDGVQFHPESILTPQGKALLANFLRTTSPTFSAARERELTVIGY